MCRMCAVAVESPEHALLLCDGNEELSTRRTQLFALIATRWPEFTAPVDATSAVVALQSLLSQPLVAREFGRYINAVFDIFNAVPLVWPEDLVTDTRRRSTAPA